MSPSLSIVVIVHDMPHQGLNTLRSLAVPHQRDVDPADYEIIVVENESDRMIGEQAATAVAGNIRYFQRDNVGQSPVPSLIFGLEQTSSEYVGMVIDGARMVTPRVVSLALAAFRISDQAVVAVPGYHLGADEQHRNPDHDEQFETQLLERLDWTADGYRLFAASVFFRGRHQHGYLLPAMESNCLFCPRRMYDEVGGFDTRFDMPGGGMANLDLYKRLVERPRTRLFVTPGEGTFHQFHGGVTTQPDEKREEKLAAFREQYARIRGDHYTLVEKPPTLIGPVTGWAMRMLEFSSSCGMRELLP